MAGNLGVAAPGSAADTNTVVFDLDAPSFSSDHFRMFEFKVKRCPRVKPHDWACCPFSHANEKAKRRDPRLCKYSGTACPEFRRNGCCRRSEQCPFAHGIFECWMHPSRYRTQMCSEVLECKRRVCFFAHTEAELRRPVDDATWMQQHGVLNAAAVESMDSGAHREDTLSDTLKMSQALTELGNTIGTLVSASPPLAAASAGPDADVWPALQQLIATGQCDPAQLLLLARNLGTTRAGASVAVGAHDGAVAPEWQADPSAVAAAAQPAAISAAVLPSPVDEPAKDTAPACAPADNTQPEQAGETDLMAGARALIQQLDGLKGQE